MYRNRLEKLSRNLSAKCLVKYFSVVVEVFSCKQLKKSNYREYIKGEIKSRRSALNPHKKVLLELISLKGACEREKILFMSFQTWLTLETSTLYFRCLFLGLQSRLTVQVNLVNSWNKG